MDSLPGCRRLPAACSWGARAEPRRRSAERRAIRVKAIRRAATDSSARCLVQEVRPGVRPARTGRSPVEACVSRPASRSMTAIWPVSAIRWRRHVPIRRRPPEAPATTAMPVPGAMCATVLGGCVGTDPVVCAAADQCHVAGVCDPATGACSNPNVLDGTACNDDNACTAGDVCIGGACVEGTAVDCSTGNPCLVGGCDPVSGCYTVPKAAGTACDADDDACTVGDACDGAGVCVPGQVRTCGPCLRCNSADGICEPDPTTVGTDCPGDGNQCFGGFQCNAAGACVGVEPVVCAPLDQCHVAGECDRMTGACSNPDALDGTSCDDENACTRVDTCQSGVCEGSDEVVCDDGNACTNNSCNPVDGSCVHEPQTGGACQTDSDAAGICAAGDCCVAVQGACNVTADCCDPSNVCASRRPVSRDGAFCRRRATARWGVSEHQVDRARPARPSASGRRPPASRR